MINGENEDFRRHPIWTGFATGVVTFILTAIATVFLFGRQIGTLRQELNDVVQWKQIAAPQITRMDRSGSLSFENFKQNYDSEQTKQYERLKVLETQIQHIQTIELRIDRLERKIGDDPKPKKP